MDSAPDRRISIAVDFDGVLHSYTSGWHGTTTIADPPVPGALEWLAGAVRVARVIIHTSRLAFDKASEYHEDTPIPERIEAMKGWMLRHCLNPAAVDALEWHTGPGKPHAHIYIDDRGHRFNGTFPSVETLAAIVPWNRTPATVDLKDQYRDLGRKPSRVGAGMSTFTHTNPSGNHWTYLFGAPNERWVRREDSRPAPRSIDETHTDALDAFDAANPVAVATSGALTLPGPAWLRECSPGVLLRVEREGVHWSFLGRKGVVWRIQNGKASMAIDGIDMVVIAPLEAIALDLTHETGLQHAVWGLAERAGMVGESARAWLVIGSDGVRKRWMLRLASFRLSKRWDLDSKPESMAHAVHAVCMKEQALSVERLYPAPEAGGVGVDYGPDGPTSWRTP